MPKFIEIIYEDFGYGLVEIGTRLVEYNPNPVHTHDEKGQFGGAGGGGNGGDSGESGGGGVNAAPSKQERDKAREEFKFLDKRLAAGNLKPGEKSLIQRRQEKLAKTVLGVKD